MLFSLNVGKVDAGVAVLLTEDMRVIEFPSILLPDGIKSGSIVDISVSRNRAAEASKEKDFRQLQDSIWETYGKHTPKAPVLRCRNTTQTAVVLEWDPLELATAKIRSFSIYRNGEKLGSIPNPMSMTSTKISGLAIDKEYSFQLELRTSSGLYKSDLLRIKTHKMTELSGITVTPGILPAEQREVLINAVERIGGRIADTVRLDTTHFVCTEGRGKEWDRAREMNIPVVRPEWVEGCEQEGRMVGVKDYYLDANPKLRPMPQLTRQISQNEVSSQQGAPPSQADSTASSSRAVTAREDTLSTPTATISAAARSSHSADSRSRSRASDDRASDSDDPEEPAYHQPGSPPDTTDDERDEAERGYERGKRAQEEDDPEEEEEGADPSNFEEVAL